MEFGVASNMLSQTGTEQNIAAAIAVIGGRVFGSRRARAVKVDCYKWGTTSTSSALRCILTGLPKDDSKVAFFADKIASAGILGKKLLGGGRRAGTSGRGLLQTAQTTSVSGTTFAAQTQTQCPEAGCGSGTQNDRSSGVSFLAAFAVAGVSAVVVAGVVGFSIYKDDRGGESGITLETHEGPLPCDVPGMGGKVVSV